MRGLSVPRIADTFDVHWVLDPVTGCHIWQRARGSHGYGVVWVKGKLTLAHRYACELAGKPISPHLHGCHSCDVRACVNPAHIFPGTDLDNHRDSIAKGRARRGIHLGEANMTAKLTGKDVRVIRRTAAAGIQQTVLAARYGVHKTNISCIVRGITWRHLAQ